MAQAVLPITSRANTDANLASDFVSNDQAITAQVNGNLDNSNLAANAVTTAKITDANVTTAKIADANVTDAKLASPNNSVYRTILQDRVSFVPSVANGTYPFCGVYVEGGNPSPAPVTSGSNLPFGQNTQLSIVPNIVYFDDADYTVASLTQKLRVRAQIATNATAPGFTFTVGLYPVTVAGATVNLAFTLGTVVSGSTVAFASPSASTISQNNSGDFTVPADGAYVFGVVTSGSVPGNSVSLLSAQLQSRNV